MAFTGRDIEVLCKVSEGDDNWFDMIREDETGLKMIESLYRYDPRLKTYEKRKLYVKNGVVYTREIYDYDRIIEEWIYKDTMRLSHFNRPSELITNGRVSKQHTQVLLVVGTLGSTKDTLLDVTDGVIDAFNDFYINIMGGRFNIQIVDLDHKPIDIVFDGCSIFSSYIRRSLIACEEHTISVPGYVIVANYQNFRVSRAHKRKNENRYPIECKKIRN
jgi:hypothetical protein